MYAHRRHDISDRVWENIQAHLPGKKGGVGRPAGDNRLFINAVFWILRTGAPWRDLPPDLGDWKNTHRRFCRWRDRGVWEKLLRRAAKGRISLDVAFQYHAVAEESEEKDG